MEPPTSGYRQVARGPYMNAGLRSHSPLLLHCAQSSFVCTQSSEPHLAGLAGFGGADTRLGLSTGCSDSSFDGSLGVGDGGVV